MSNDNGTNDNAPALPTEHAEAIEAALIGGDLSKLKTDERVAYYNAICKSMDLNPLTRPFEYIVLNNKLTLYARSGCAEQLRAKRHISLSVLDRKISDKLCIVTVRAKMPDGREDESCGITSIGGLAGDQMANALMKAETKAKRRVTLSICGLGMADESELETIPRRRAVDNEADQSRAEAATEQAKAAHIDPQAAAAAMKQLPTPETPVVFAPPAPSLAELNGQPAANAAKEATRTAATEATPRPEPARPARGAQPPPAPARVVDDLQPHERPTEDAPPPSQMTEDEYLRKVGEPKPGRRTPASARQTTPGRR